MPANSLNSNAFKLKGRLYTLTTMQLQVGDIQLLDNQLAKTIASAPKFFEHTPVVVDCSELPSPDFELTSLYNVLKHHHIIPVAVQGIPEHMVAEASTLGLAVMHASSSLDKPLMPAQDNKTASEFGLASSVPPENKHIMQPVRSGQQVVAKGGDLIVSAPVSPGAEVLADGNIHVYGPLRGRALAGISGNKEARIFCMSLEAELLSIAGSYCLSDAITPHDGPCQIFLKEGHIHIEPLC